MDLSKYDIIRRPVVSDKASTLLRKNKQVVLQVHAKANKQEIAKAIEQLFEVKVEKVRIIVRKGKVKKSKRISFQRATKKKAIVTLKEGYSFDKLAQTNPMADVSAVSTSEEIASKDA